MGTNRNRVTRATPTGHRMGGFIFPLLMFASGAAGLTYEVVWARQLTEILGASAVAVTIVLATFMGGLGAGSWWIGRVADRLPRHQLIRLYAGLESCIAGYGLAFPLLLSAGEWAYVAVFRDEGLDLSWSAAVRIALSAGLLLVPTVMMGGTLPVMGRLLMRLPAEVGHLSARLYAWNTFGAALGVVLTGYLLLPRFGQAASAGLAAAVNLAVAAGTVLAVRFVGTASAPPVGGKADPGPISRRTPMPVLAVAYAVSGAAAMTFEVAWTRALSMILGTTVYAFATMLATFLLGIAAGSAVYRLLPGSVVRPSVFGGLLAAVGVAVLSTMPMMNGLPLAYLALKAGMFEGWMGVQLLRGLLAGLVIIGPTLLMGVTFPLAVSLLKGTGEECGGPIGRAYATNTAGAVLGTVAAGLVLIPAVGIQRTLLIGCALDLAAAIMVVAADRRVGPGPRLVRGGGLLAAGLAAAWVLFSPWEPRLLSSGVYLYADQYIHASERYNDMARKRDDIEQRPPAAIWAAAMLDYDLLYFDSGPVATVAVMRNRQGVRSLLINGKVDASVGGPMDMRTQTMLGLLPVGLHPHPAKVLVVGLGSGVTAGAALRYPEVERLTIAELSASVVRAAQLFKDANNGVFSDPRARVVIRDARNLLMTSRQNFDVIISQPSNPWIRGETSLFTIEWYRLAREHLAPAGILAQWLPAYAISERNLKVILATMRSVFPDVSLWSAGAPGDLLMLARRDGDLLAAGAMSSRFTAPGLREALESIHISPAGLPGRLELMDRPAVDAYLASLGGRPALNTDDLPVTEFATPRDMVDHLAVRRFTAQP